MPSLTSCWPSHSRFMLGRMRATVGKMHPTQLISRAMLGSVRATVSIIRQKPANTRRERANPRHQGHRTRNQLGRMCATEHVTRI
jgi:hypothetical protein